MVTSLMRRHVYLGKPLTVFCLCDWPGQRPERDAVDRSVRATVPHATDNQGSFRTGSFFVNQACTDSTTLSVCCVTDWT